MTFSAPIFTKLTVAPEIYVEIYCTEVTQFGQKSRDGGKFSFTPLSKVLFQRTAGYMYGSLGAMYSDDVPSLSSYR
jgi:hypothetical protein